jgi:TatD DNase family protein
MWIDTHCHLDAAEFGEHAVSIADAAWQAGVSGIVIPAVHVQNFPAVMALAAQRRHCYFALGIHPLYVDQAQESDLQILRTTVQELLSDPGRGAQLIAIGEIGLDFFVPAFATPAMRARQEYFYAEQLKIAREFNLPVLLHVRRSVDIILKYLRRIRVSGGIAHAFNGSEQQAQAFLDLDCKLGFGGAMTFTRALQIRRLAQTLPIESLVLETDAPDMSPAWLHPQKNSPAELPHIAAVLAELRQTTLPTLAAATRENALAVLPRMHLKANHA